MKFIETKLLGDNRIKSRKMRAARRPISLILTLLLVIGLFSLVILVVVPELVNTFTLMVENINEFIPTMKEWILVIFKDNTDVQKWLNAHPLDVNTLLQKLVEFLQNGAGDFLSGTISQVAGVITGVVDFAMGFVFACYILAQKERLAEQVRRLGQAVFSERQYIRAEEICALFYKNFSSFIAGQCMDAAILGVMFVVGDNLPSAICALNRRSDRLYDADPCPGSFYRMRGRHRVDPYGESDSGGCLRDPLPRAAAA